MWNILEDLFKFIANCFYRLLKLNSQVKSLAPHQDLNPGPLAHEAKIIPLDQRADVDGAIILSIFLKKYKC